MRELFKINSQEEFVDYILNAILTAPTEAEQFEYLINILSDERRNQELEFYAEFGLPGRVFEVVYNKSVLQTFIDSDEVFQKYAIMVPNGDEVYVEDIENMFKNSSRVSFDGEKTTLLKELVSSIPEVERKFRSIISGKSSSYDDLDPRLYLNTIVPNVKMDSQWFYDIKISKLIGDEIVDTLTDPEDKEIYSPDYTHATERTQHAEIEFLKDNTCIHTDKGFFLKPRYREELHLYTRGIVEDDKYAFAIVLKRRNE